MTIFLGTYDLRCVILSNTRDFEQERALNNLAGRTQRNGLLALQCIMEIIFNGIIKFFQFCGLSPVAVPDPENNNSNHRSTAVADTSLLIWSILITVPLFVYVVLCALYYQELMDMFGSMGKVNAGAKGGAIIVTHFVVSFEAIWSRRSLCVIWQKLYAVDGLLKEIGVNVQQLQRGFYRNYSWKFVGYSTFTLGSELIIYFVVSNNPEWSRFWLATIVSLMVIRWKHLQHVLYVDVLTSRFGVIRQELERISARSKVVMSTELLEHMKRLMGAYTLLYDMSDRLGRTCNLSQLANLTQNFVQLSGDLYWMYSMLYRNLFNTLPGKGLLVTFAMEN